MRAFAHILDMGNGLASFEMSAAFINLNIISLCNLLATNKINSTSPLPSHLLQRKEKSVHHKEVCSVYWVRPLVILYHLIKIS